MTQKLKIRPLNQQDMSAWDDYVDHHPDGSFFHLMGWYHVISAVFNHKPHYMVAECNGKIVGVLPLFEQKSRMFGHALISTPFCVYGGAIADTLELKNQLEHAALELGQSLNVDYVELRDKTPTEDKSPWVTHCRHSTFSSTLAETPEEILTNVKRKQRAVIRHSLANHLSWDSSDNPSVCYDIYAQSVHNLGTPVFNKKLFDALKQAFGERCETLIIRDENREPVSAVLSFYYKETVLPYYGGGTHAARDLKSNDFMYYQLMCLAKERGMKVFDFGRSKVDSGAYHYKKHWGMDEEKLHYRIALVKAKELPNLSPNNPKYRLFIDLWKKMPLGLSRQIGPQISKFLG